MNYKKIYDSIIENRKNNPVIGYSEKHHILPKSLGGNDEEENLICLTAREHFICHWLLTKMQRLGSTEYYKMIKAFMMMSVSSDNQERYNSKIFEKYKIEFSKAQKLSQTGKGNSQHGSRWINNPELKQNKKLKMNENLEDGWFFGRVNFELLKKKNKEKIKKEEKKKKKELKNKKYYKSLYDLFLDSEYSSLRKFAKNSDYEKSHVSLIKNFKKYVEGFETKHGKSFK